eukprot:gnl/MRDRNA2_/MRDRNA2_105432_c0_seq1.p1 gnl/MRDRNA2_/MRDRNA2_105432_c0~~gnl/MRDRNA2_/MRDRNA2_105432_c0_seq1.p1  ORF type:complete len:569 (+),score=90.36 gnl/MRDRNA2_/MRDRNA2_105432_c0_seq1:210-1709(+)
MTAAHCYHMAARSCQTPRVVQRMSARTLQEAIQSGVWRFNNGKLLVKKDFIVVDSTLYVPAGGEVVRMVSVKRKHQIDVAYVMDLSADELVEVSFLNPPGAYGSPYCTRCVSWTMDIQHVDASLHTVEQLGTCSFCEEQCSNVRERSDAWQYLFTVEGERLAMQIEQEAAPLPGPPACEHAKKLISEDRCKIMSSQWADMAQDCRKAWCSVDTCNYGFQVPAHVDCNNEAISAITTTTAQSLIEFRSSATPAVESSRQQRLRKSEDANDDIRLYFLYVIGSAAGALTLCSCFFGICSLLKSLNEERDLSRSESREPSVLKRHVEQARLVSAFVPEFVRSKSGRHIRKKAQQMPLDPIVAQHGHMITICVDNLQDKKGVMKAAWEEDDASTFAGSRRPSWQSDLKSGVKQASLQPSSASMSSAGSRRPSWQSESNPVARPTSLQPSDAGSRRPSWQSDFSSGASNSTASAHPSLQPGVFSTAALQTIGSSLRSSQRNGQC